VSCRKPGWRSKRPEWQHHRFRPRTLQGRDWWAPRLGFAISSANRCKNSALQQGVDLSERSSPHHGCRVMSSAGWRFPRSSAWCGARPLASAGVSLEGSVGFRLKVPLGLIGASPHPAFGGGCWLGKGPLLQPSPATPATRPPPGSAAWRRPAPSCLQAVLCPASWGPIKKSAAVLAAELAQRPRPTSGGSRPDQQPRRARPTWALR